MKLRKLDLMQEETNEFTQKTSFDKNHIAENKFAKSNPNYLNSMFGTTDVTPLWIADMDFKIADPITNELQRLVNRGVYGYEFNANEVFQSIADWNLKRNNLELNPESFLQVPGVLTGIALLIRELSKEGDGILIQTPVYHQFSSIIKTANREIVENPLKIESGNYQMDFDDMELKLKTNKVKIILLCNPHNPVGRVWRKEDLQKLIELANTYKAVIISDEIHSDIIFSKAKFTSIASFPNSQNHVVVLGSPAKTFGMHSISNGYLYIPNTETHKQLNKTISSMYLDHGNALSTYATIAAYRKGEAWLDELMVYLENTVEWIQEFLQMEMPEVKMFNPEGTYQIWLDFSQLNLSEEDLKKLIATKAKLALTPGNWFGGEQSQFMRMNIASPLSVIQKSFIQLKSAINNDL